MTATWIVIGVLCVGTVGLKASGPAGARDADAARAAISVIALVAPAILTSLVVYETLSDGHAGLTIDARIAGTRGRGRGRLRAAADDRDRGARGVGARRSPVSSSERGMNVR